MFHVRFLLLLVLDTVIHVRFELLLTFVSVSVSYTNGETERLQGFRRDPLRDKIREVGRGLSLADTQTGR